jgi:penicillin-binding protein 1A
MYDMLRGVARQGTAARLARDLGRADVGGKTGTTNDSHDAWFAGFTPEVVGVAWMGFDKPRSLGSRETGGGASLPIWLDYMRVALEGVPVAEPGQLPDGLIRENGEFYFAEFPPGEAVARVGLPSPEEMLLNGQVPEDMQPADSGGGNDGIGALLNQLTGGGGNTSQQAQPQRIQF